MAWYLVKQGKILPLPYLKAQVLLYIYLVCSS